MKLSKMLRKSGLMFLLTTILVHSASSQPCDPTVPTFNVDLTAAPNMSWTSPPVSRNGSCCGSVNPDRCLEFVITLHPQTIAINFQISAGAVPPGALFYQVNCGPITPVGSPICLIGPGPHILTFCKPGNNINEFTITAYSSPIIGPDISLNAGCQSFIYANYYNEPSVTWTSIAPGVQGAWDGLLSCTSGCDTTFVTANPGAPAFVDYLVCGMDIGGCNPLPICDTIRVNFIQAVGVSLSALQMALCPGATTTITATGSGGTAPYNYLWNTLEITSSIVGGPGTYYVDVTDTSGCFVASDTIVIVANPLPLVNAGPDQQVCDGVAVTLSGAGAVSYVWDNGVTDGVPFVPAVGTLTYTVTGTDANGCVNTDQVDVTVFPLPVVNAGVDQQVCDGVAVTLSGAGAVSYVWDNGVVDGVPFTPVVGTLTYTVTGTDVNGCTNIDQVDVTVFPLPVVNAGIDQQVCDGVAVTLSGSGTVSYVWDNGVVDGVPFTPAVGTITYTVTGTDGNGCVNTDQVDVTVFPLPPVNAGVDQQVCDGIGVFLNGSGAVSYLWDNGVTDGLILFPPVGTTTYTVTGTDANGCINTDQVDVTVLPLPVINAGPDQQVCDGSAVTLSGAGAVSYVWNQGITDGVPFTPVIGTLTYTVTGTDVNGCTNIDQVDVTVFPLPVVNAGIDQQVCDGVAVTLSGSGTVSYVWDNGVVDGVPFNPAVGTLTYTVTGTDANGCVNTDQVDVTVFPLPVISAGPDQQVCEAVAVTKSGAGGVSYVWDNGITDGVPFIPPVGTTTYTVTGTDANGCVNTDQANVTVFPLPAINAGPDQQVCDGIGVFLNGSGGVSYLWDNGVTDGLILFPPIGTTTYTVTGTDANGCINTDQVDVTVFPLPVINAGVDQQVCDGSAVTLSGSGGVSYVWNQGITDGVPFTPSVGTLTYTVTGTDANGCVNTDQVDVTVFPLPVVNAGIDQQVCDGVAVTLSGSGAVSYVWDNGVVDGVPFTPVVGTITYTVTGTDANGCVNTDQVDVTVFPLPAVNAGLDQQVCDGSAVTLNGSGAISYVWNNGITDGVPFTPVVGTLTYTVTGTDANGCTNIDQVDVTVFPLPVVNAGVDQQVCSGSSVTLSGSGAVSYVWDNGVTDGVPFFPAVGTLTYTVTGTDANGCVNTDQINVTVFPLPVINAGVNQQVCEGSAVTLTGAGGVSYVWDNGVTNGIPFTPAIGTLTYTLIGTDANGCVNTDQVDVTVFPLPAVNAGVDQQVCDGIGVFLNGSGAVSYLWDNGVTDGLIHFPPVGTTTYTVTGTDANGCINTDQVDVTVFPLPVINAGVDQQVCDGSAVTLNGSGGVSYVWNNGITDGIPFTPVIGTLTYTVTGTDANGCVNTDQVDVTVFPLPVVNAGIDQQVCEGVAVTLNGSGAVSYVWDNGIVDGVPFTPAVGTLTYTVTGTDANGCVNIDQVDVTVFPLPAVNAGLDQQICIGFSTTLSGSGAVSYVWDNGVVDGVPFTPAVGTITYTVTGTDVNGCVNTDQVNITVDALPVIDAGNDETICEFELVTLTATGAPSLIWNLGVVNGVPFNAPLGITTYTVTGTDLNGCVNTDEASVTTNGLPSVSAGPDQSVCVGESVTLSGSGATSYSWTGGVIDGVAFTPAVGSYEFIVTGLNGNLCGSSDTVNVIVNPNPVINAGADQVGCESDLITLSATGSANLYWDNGVVNNVPFTQSIGTVIYTVTDSLSTGCTATDIVSVEINPNPVVTAVGDEICEGEGVTLTGQGALSYAWTGGVFNGVEFFPTVTGPYTVTGTNAFGCSAQATVTVKVNPAPIVNFRILDLVLSTSSPGTGFENLTLGAVSYEWNFGDGSSLSNEFEPYHEFPAEESGSYEITLTAYSAAGCPGQKVKYVYVTQDYTIYVPNAFTPDGSGTNEIFKPVMDGFDENDYTLYIFNRWGELIFESHDMDVGWDGEYSQHDERVQDGVFTWKVVAGLKDSGDTKIFVGHVSLLK